MAFREYQIDTVLLKDLCDILHIETSQIKLHETFVRNGGDSLLAIRFSNAIRKLKAVRIGAGVILRAEHLGSLIDNNELRQWAATSTSSKMPESELPSVIESNESHHEGETSDPIQRFPKRIPTSGLPITFIQAGTAHYTHLVPGAAVQHVTQYCFTDSLHRLRDAFAQVLGSYQTFKLKLDVQTSPLAINASLKQAFALNWSESELSSTEGENLERSFRGWGVEASTEPIFRVLTPTAGSEEGKLSIVHWFCHLSLMDGRSMDIVLRHVDALMEESTPTLTVNDGIFDVVRQLTDYREQHKAAAKAYWAVHEVPPSARNHCLLQALGTRMTTRVRMESIEVLYPEDVKVFQSRMGFTFEILVRAAMALVLSKLQGSSRVSLMTVSSRRSLPIESIEEVVGSFAASMILSIEINKDDTAQALLSQVFDKVFELEELSFSDPEDGFSLGGLVVVSSDLQPHAPWYSGGRQTDVMSPKETLPTIYVGAAGRLRVCFNSQWRTSAEMRVMTDLLLAAMINLGGGSMNVGECIKEMPTTAQRAQTINWGRCNSGDTTADVSDDDIVSLFERRVHAEGKAPALQIRNASISYDELATMVRAVGRRVQSLLKPGSVVLVHADGSAKWVVAMLAVLWAKCIFSPQGATIPHQLRSHHYGIAKADAFILPRDDPEIPSPDDCQLRLCVKTILQEHANGFLRDHATHDERQPEPRARAYICFSSGTTGRPKAIQCHHAGIVSLLQDPIARLHVQPGHRVAQIMSPVFDGALLEVFSVLCYGGTLVLRDPSDPFAHLQSVDSVLLTPSLATELDPEDFQHLKYVYFGAEVLPQSLADRWSSGHAAVYNLYGPTECHIVASAQKIEPGKPVTIGRPVSATRIYILDTHGDIVSPLVAGEIYVAGVQVSHGYVDLEKENKTSFISDTICPGSGTLMYRTGDWGYWTAEGEIAFVGRTDRQVKLAGFRLDLNDIESRIQGVLPQESRVAVLVLGNILRCLVTGPIELTPEQIRTLVEHVLSPHQIPKVIRYAESMPIMSTGKIDWVGVANWLE